MKTKYFKVCRVRCKRCGTVLEYVNRSRQDNGLGSALMCSCGKVGLDPSACLYRILGDRENYEDLSEPWEIADNLLVVEQDRAAGKSGCTVEELEEHLDKMIKGE